MDKKTVSRGTMASMALRTLLLEASWNSKGMQNLGFCFSIMPVLKRLYSGEALKKALKRHLSVFNTNPVLSGFLVGAIAEQEIACGSAEGACASRLHRMKSSLGGVFGAIGDDLLWNSVRPFLGSLAVLLFLLGNLWAFVVMVSAFAVLNVGLRFVGVSLGLRGVSALHEFISRLKPGRTSAMLKRATSVLLGAIAGLLLASDEFAFGEVEGSGYVSLMLLAVVAVCFMLRAKNVPTEGIVMGISIVCLLEVFLVF